MSTPSSPSNLGHGAEEERSKQGGEEERGKATKTVKADAGDDDGGGFITIKVVSVVSQTADDVWFRVKRGVKLRRLMDMYCDKHLLDPYAVVFLDPVAGRPIRSYQTTDEVGLEDGDEIYILLRQGGGVPSSPSAPGDGETRDVRRRSTRSRRPNSRWTGDDWTK